MRTIERALETGAIPDGQYAYPGNRRYAVFSLATGERVGIVVRMFSNGGQFHVDTMSHTFRVSGYRPEHEIRKIG